MVRSLMLGLPRAVRPGRGVDTVCWFLARERPLWLLLAASGALALLYGLALWDTAFLAGTSAYWGNPRDIRGNGGGDISTALSGYDYFLRDAWRLPLFQVEKLGAPEGTNIIFTDSVPLLALAGRLLFRVSGYPVNPYGAWTLFCLIALAVALTALVAKLGSRGLAPMLAATTIALNMPAWLARWGHLAAMAQFEILLAFLFYGRYRTRGTPLETTLAASALLTLALWTNAYLCAMSTAIVLACIFQAAGSGVLRWYSALSILAGIALLITALMFASGYLPASGTLAGDGFGYFSMNLLSPFVPQRSGVFPEFSNLTLDATGGQHEGFGYFGAGVLLLFLTTISWQVRALRNGYRAHAVLLLVLAGFVAFAVSNTVFLGKIQLFTLPLPSRLLKLAAIFRSSGRFFWPVMYAVVATSIAAVIPRFGPRGALLLVAAAMLQWLDVEPLRTKFATSIAAPAPAPIDLTAWRMAIAGHDSVRVLPAYACLPWSKWNRTIAVQLQLMAAEADVPINSVYAARFSTDCAAEQKIEGGPAPGGRGLSVYFPEFTGFEKLRARIASMPTCRAGPELIVCSDSATESDRLSDLVRVIDR